MSKKEIDQARENFERLTVRTAKRVLDFYDARRNAPTVVSPPIVPTVPAKSAALTG
jgi:hypothetical protein